MTVTTTAQMITKMAISNTVGGPYYVHQTTSTTAMNGNLFIQVKGNASSQTGFTLKTLTSDSSKALTIVNTTLAPGFSLVSAKETEDTDVKLKYNTSTVFASNPYLFAYLPDNIYLSLGDQLAYYITGADASSVMIGYQGSQETYTTS